jgi:MFS family permease
LEATTQPSVQPSVLSHRPFLLFWLGRIISVLAYHMTMVALAWQLYALTDSALALGFIGLAQFIPIVLLTLPVGHLSDRYDRCKIVRTCQWISASAAIVLVLGTRGGWLDSYVIYAVVIVLGSMRAFEVPTMGATVPNLVPPHEVPRAMAWFASANQAAQIIGPALGGALYIFGPALVYGLSVTLWLIASVFMMIIVVERVMHPQKPLSLKSLLAGFSFVLRDRVILGTASLDLFAVLFGGATALLPIFARDILHTGPWGLGLLRSAPAVGALVMSLILARYPLKPPIGPILFGVILLFGGATISFALSTHIILSMFALCIMGASDVVSVVIRFSLVQLRTPDEMRGRVSAANSLFIGTSNQLGDFESGVVAALVGAVPAVVIGGVGTIAVAVLWMLVLFPELYRIYNLENDERPDAVPQQAGTT